MASGSFVVSTDHTYVAGVVEWESTADTANNRSKVVVKMKLRRTNTGYTTWGSGEFFVTINGTKKSVNKSFEITSSWQTMVEATVYVDHNADGKKSITIKWGGDTDVFNIYDDSENVTLDTIPRESSLSSNANFTAGSDKTFSISRHASFRHEIELYVQRRDGVYDWIKQVAFSTSETSKSTAFTAAQKEEIFKHLDGRSSASVKVDLQTFDGNTHIGSREYFGTVSAPGASTVKNVNGQMTKYNNPRDVYVDQQIIIDLTRNDNEFTHTVEITVGGFKKTFTGVGTRVTWTPSSAEQDAIYTEMANASVMDGNIRVYTYYGAEVVRSYTDNDINFYVRNSDPLFNEGQVSFADINPETLAVTGNDQYVIQNLSHLTVRVDSAATGQNGATISQYEISIAGQTKSLTSAGSVTFESINAEYDTELSVKAVDSRGISTTVKKTVKVLSYANPTLEALVNRLNNFENQTTITANGELSSFYVDGVEKNAITALQYRFKESSATTWGAWVPFDLLTGGTSYSVEAMEDLDNTKSYNVEVQVSDKLRTTTVARAVSTGKPILFIDAIKKSIGLGDFPVGENEFFVNMAMMLGANRWASRGAAFNAGNSDMVGLNGLFFADVADNNGEGLQYLRDGASPGSSNQADYYNIRVTGDGRLLLDNEVIGRAGGKVMWEGAAYMHQDQVLDATTTNGKLIPLSQCPTGWLFVWSDFDWKDSTGTVINKVNPYNVVYTFVHKSHINWFNGEGTFHSIPGGDNYDSIVNKYLYVADTWIKGSPINDGDEANNIYGWWRDIVLRKVIAF